MQSMPKCYCPRCPANTDCGNAVDESLYVDKHSLAVAFPTGGNGPNVLMCQACEWKTEKK